MIQFAISKGLNIRSTMFPHKDIHKVTWYTADSRIQNQIDYDLISNRCTSAITDMRALSRPDIGKDYNLLKIKTGVEVLWGVANESHGTNNIYNIYLVLVSRTILASMP
jgi:hypothetical protein